jgi:hypothetical protein
MAESERRSKMPRSDYEDVSELEREVELEMEDENEPLDEEELEEEFEDFDEEEPEEEEFEDIDEEEPEDEGEFEAELEGFADRFYELSTREFESEAEVDGELGRLFEDMEREFFFKRLRKAFKAGKRLAKRAVRKARRVARGLPAFQGLRAISQLARGNLKGLLGSLAKAGLASAIPGGAAILPALQALGFRETADPEENREAWESFVNVSQEAFENLAENLNERADDPLEASRLATNAFQSALRKTQIRVPSVRSRGFGRKRRIALRKGDVLVIAVK